MTTLNLDLYYKLSNSIDTNKHGNKEKQSKVPSFSLFTGSLVIKKKAFKESKLKIK